MEMSRREFIKKNAKILLLFGTGSLLAPFLTKKVLAQPGPTLFRPPGALPEETFLDRCIRCFKCAEACPYGTIKFTSWSQNFAADTPYLPDLKENPCFLCMKCTHVCPTGALEKIDAEQEAILNSVKIGTAVISNTYCVIINGERRRCHFCIIRCPFRHLAITMDEKGFPIIDPRYCIGCGICVQACPFAPEAIEIIPREDR